MASLYQKRVVSKATGDVSLYWYVSYYQNGKHRSKSAGKSKTVANKLKRRIEAELETGKFDFLNQPENVLICVSVDEYLGQIERLRKYRTHIRYKNALTHLHEFLVDAYPSITSVSRLKSSHFAEYQAWRRGSVIKPNGHKNTKSVKPPTFKTINVELSIFRTWMNWSIQAGQLLDNPLSGLKSLKTTDSKPRRVLTREEFDKLIEVSKDIETKDRKRKGQTSYWRFLVNTGLRVDEMRHLQWRDIDFKRGVIKVQRKPFWNPKTYEREIPFTPDSERILKERSSNEPKPDKFVFQGVISKQLSHTQVRRWLIDCANKAGIYGVRGPHDLRHTFITWGLTEFGIDIATMQLIAGHRNLETTQIYVHPTTSHMKDAMRGFGSSD